MHQKGALNGIFHSSPGNIKQQQRQRTTREGKEWRSREPEKITPRSIRYHEGDADSTAGRQKIGVLQQQQQQQQQTLQKYSARQSLMARQFENNLSTLKPKKDDAVGFLGRKKYVVSFVLQQKMNICLSNEFRFDKLRNLDLVIWFVGDHLRIFSVLWIFQRCTGTCVLTNRNVEKRRSWPQTNYQIQKKIRPSQL